MIERDELIDQRSPADGVRIIAERSHERAVEVPYDSGASQPEEHQDFKEHGCENRKRGSMRADQSEPEDRAYALR